MTTKTLVLPFVVVAAINAGLTPGGVAAEKPPGRPDAAPERAAGLVLKRFSVPPLPVPSGRLHIPMTNSAGINDEGTRVIVDNRPAVDVWDTAKGTCVRSMSAPPDWGMGCNVIIARDASYFYVRNDTTKKIEAHDERGSLIGARPQIGLAPTFGLKRSGYDFAARDYIMGSKIGTDGGIWTFDPKTGGQRIVVRIKNIWDVQLCHPLVQRPDGDFFGYYNKAGVSGQRRGLYTIARNGKGTKIAGIPSDGINTLNWLSQSKDGRYLAFQGSDRLEVWDLQARQLVLDWRQEYRTPREGRFTGDGRLAILSVKTSIKEIATSGRTGGYMNRTARLDVLEIPSLRVAGELDLTDFEGLGPAFAFSPNGKQLVLADPDQVALIDVARTFPGK